MTSRNAPSLVVPDACERWLEGRGSLYQLYAEFLGRRPKLSMIAEWSLDRRIGALLDGLDSGRELRSCLYTRNAGDLPGIWEREAQEYDRLTSLRAAGLAAARESELRGEKEDFCNVLSGIYAESGIVFKKCGAEADDHIAIELEFMSILHEEMMFNSFSVRSALERLETQEKFLEEHLLLWAPGFCAKLTAATESPLYRGLARLLEEFLPYDLEMLRSWRAALEAGSAALV
ncbi:molecular chaperone [Paenibacillus spiritus]|nr:molecular chaperone TorD family protein [Paenibacillus spiritus]